MFNVDFKDIALKWIEPDLRKTKIMDFIYSLLKPAKTINNNLQALKSSIDTKLQYNGQVINLERYLNDLYDPILRGIFISDAPRLEIKYRFNKLEARPPVYHYNNAEGGTNPILYNQDEYAGGFNFYVNIPNYVSFSPIVMTDQINIYKLAGKRFDFIIYVPTV